MTGEYHISVPASASLQRLLMDGTMTGLSETQLLERFLARGDQAAFEAIVLRHGPMVLGVCRRLLGDPHDVEDAFQATFLILLRKAGSIRDRQVLGTWLYGVARRVAVRLRTSARRRRARELVEAVEVARESAHLGWEESTELKEILDEEVGRLTDKYRSPVVLCDLEGQTLEQAAASLRCPVGTVKSRLSRARQKLRSRLLRRGFSPSIGFLAATLAPEPAGALRAELVGSTIEAATHLAAGRAASAGVVSATVAAILNDTLRSMSMSALKFVAVVLTAAGIVATSAGVLAFQAPRAASNKTVVASQRQPAPPEKKYTESFKQFMTKEEFKAELDKAKTAPTADQSQSIDSLAKARLQAAEKLLEQVRKDYLEGDGSLSLEFARSRALTVLEARLSLSQEKVQRVAAYEDYLKFMKELEAKKKARGEITDFAEYNRLEAEFWLAQAKVGKEPRIAGSGFGGQPGSEPGTQPGSGPAGRPGTDPRSQALLARLEEPVPMSFPNPTPLSDVLKYIQQATAGPNGEPIPIYVQPVNPEGSGLDDLDAEKLMKTPITIDLVGVPLRRSLKLIAEQLGMGYGIRDGMVTMRPPDMRYRNWHELMVMDESFPMSSPLDVEVERARRGEMTTAELDALNEKLKGIDEITKHYRSIRSMGGGMTGGMQARPQPAANPGAQPGR
jgi:RNA polymerase sigma factor (sigma-70 family)